MADEWQAWAEEFQSTLPARGATCEQLLAPALLLISIHAPRTGSDVASSPNTRASYTISIHAPRTGSDRQFSFPCADSVYFNPRSPHGERLIGSATSTCFCRISIHAPRTGSDGCAGLLVSKSGLFQSTLPARGATRLDGHALFVRTFQSTLPARGATDRVELKDRAFLFQSTLPARGATRISAHTVSRKLFQSTLPARGATFREMKVFLAATISIHAPRTGSDESVE